jgi:nucleoside-diphosphate-sugar epimerase
MKIAVAGSTGRVGRHAVDVLKARGHDVVVIARSNGVDLAGPRAESLVDAARRLVARRGDALRIEEVSDPSNPDSVLYENGALLPGPDAVLAGPTFDAWLEETLR